MTHRARSDGIKEWQRCPKCNKYKHLTLYHHDERPQQGKINFFVRCIKCRTESITKHSEFNAITAWNKGELKES